MLRSRHWNACLSVCCPSSATPSRTLRKVPSRLQGPVCGADRPAAGQRVLPFAAKPAGGPGSSPAVRTPAALPHGQGRTCTSGSTAVLPASGPPAVGPPVSSGRRIPVCLPGRALRKAAAGLTGGTRPPAGCVPEAQGISAMQQGAVPYGPVWHPRPASRTTATAEHPECAAS